MKHPGPGTYSWRARFGYVALAPMEIAPLELAKMAPDGVVPIATNLHLREFTAAEWADAASELPDSVRGLDRFGPDLIALDAAPLLYLDEGGSGDPLSASLAGSTSRPIVFDIRAAVDALRSLNAQRIAIASPHAALVDRIARSFARDGFSVVNVASMPHASVRDLRRRPLGLAYQVAMEAARGGRRADALFIDSADWAVAPHIDRLERELGIPVVGLCQAVVWAVLSRLGIAERTPGYGALLAAAA